MNTIAFEDTTHTKVCIATSLPSDPCPDTLYVLPDAVVSTTSCGTVKEEKRFFFPTNCINCGAALDKEGHCDSCGTYHNPTAVY